MFCDVQVPGGEPYEGDPRWVMRRALERCEGMGFDEFNIGPELEYFYFRSAETERRAAARCSTRAATSTSRRSTPARTCGARRCSRSSSSASTSSTRHHEVGPSQHEVDMRYEDALKMADDCMTYRITVKEYAMKYGFYATFMPKPLFGENGSGMHVHQSLFKGGRNAFYDAERPVLPVRRGEVVHRRPAQARPRDLCAVRAVGQLLQAAGARATRRRCTSRGRGATARP